MSINYATEYQAILDENYRKDQRSTLLFERGSKDYRWINAQTIMIPRLEVTGFRDHARGIVMQETDDYSNDWYPLPLRHDRSKKIAADKMDIEETNMARSIINLTRTFNREHKVPEYDKYTFSNLFAEALANDVELGTTELSESNILQWFDKEMERMSDLEVPEEGRLLFARPAIHTMLKNAEKISRVIQVGMNQTNITRNVRSLDDVQIIEVPSGRFKTKYDYSLGAVTAVGAGQINNMLIHPSCQISVRRFSQAIVDPLSATNSGKWVWFEREYWDNFLLRGKTAGISINYSTTGGAD